MVRGIKVISPCKKGPPKIKREMQIEKIPGASKEGRTRAVLPSSCDFYNSS